MKNYIWTINKNLGTKLKQQIPDFSLLVDTIQYLLHKSYVKGLEYRDVKPSSEESLSKIDKEVLKSSNSEDKVAWGLLNQYIFKIEDSDFIVDELAEFIVSHRGHLSYDKFVFLNDELNFIRRLLSTPEMKSSKYFAIENTDLNDSIALWFTEDERNKLFFTGSSNPLHMISFNKSSGNLLVSVL